MASQSSGMRGDPPGCSGGAMGCPGGHGADAGDRSGVTQEGPAGVGGGPGGVGTGQSLGGLGLWHQPVPLALPALGRGEQLLGAPRAVPHAEGLAGSLGVRGGQWVPSRGACGCPPTLGPGRPGVPRCRTDPEPPQPRTWNTWRAQVRNDSSWAHSSSPSPRGSTRSPPSSSSRVSTARAKAQKWGYARDPNPNTANLGGEWGVRVPRNVGVCPGPRPEHHQPEEDALWGIPKARGVRPLHEGVRVGDLGGSSCPSHICRAAGAGAASAGVSPKPQQGSVARPRTPPHPCSHGHDHAHPCGLGTTGLPTCPG